MAKKATNKMKAKLPGNGGKANFECVFSVIDVNELSIDVLKACARNGYVSKVKAAIQEFIATEYPCWITGKNNIEQAKQFFGQSDKFKDFATAMDTGRVSILSETFPSVYAIEAIEATEGKIEVAVLPYASQDEAEEDGYAFIGAGTEEEGEEEEEDSDETEG